MTRPLPRWPLPAFLLLCTFSIVWLAGCATTGPDPTIVKLSDDTYRLTIRARSGMFNMDPPEYKTQAVGQAMDFAASKGKVAVPISINENTAGVFDDWARIEYDFRLVDKNDPRANRRQPDPDAPKKPVVVKKADPGTKPDIYAELTKLDDLRKKGILTDAEFESEKKKLLAK